MNEEVLEEIGLSKNEAKVYICLLNIGMTSITHIADESKLHRANVYDSIKKLISKGLVAHVQKEDVTLYEATDPHALMRIIKEKEIRLKAILPQLVMSKQYAASKGEAHIYEGAAAFVRILYGFLEYNEPILAYGIPKIAPEMMKTMIPHFHTERIAKKILMKHIYNHNAMSRIALLKRMEFTSARYLPESFDSQVSTNICGDQVVLVLWIKPVMVIQIKNKAIAESYKQYFSLLWESAKE